MNNRNQQSAGSRAADVLIRIVLLLMVVAAIFPFVYMFLISIMEGATNMSLTITRVRTATWTLDNYIGIFKRGGIYRYTMNSAVVTIYACIVTCLVSSMAAYSFTKIRFRGSGKIYYLYVMTMMIPTQAMLIPTFLIVKNAGLLNTYTAIALPTVNAFGVILVSSFMRSIPDDLLEAADIDGCGEIRKFLTIILPLVKPVMVSLTIFTFISVWGSLLWPLVVASGEMTTLTQYIANMKNQNNLINYGAMMAASTIAFLPPFILYLFLQKQFVEGIALSGIKG